MIQIRILRNNTLTELEYAVNEFLKELGDIAIIHDIDIEQLKDCSHRAVIRYEPNSPQYV